MVFQNFWPALQLARDLRFLAQVLHCPLLGLFFKWGGTENRQYGPQMKVMLSSHLYFNKADIATFFWPSFV